MMYSDKDIHNAILNGDLIVDPYRPNMAKPAGLTLHLGELLLKPIAGKIVDVKNKIVPEYKKINITLDAPYEMQPGEFLLAHTYEKISVGNNLGFFIEGRSTLARVGLTIVQTAMLVYPGHKNRCVTLELANHGLNPILLYPLMKIARAAIFELKSPSEINYDDKGKYKDQESVGMPIFVDEFLKL